MRAARSHEPGDHLDRALPLRAGLSLGVEAGVLGIVDIDRHPRAPVDQVPSHESRKAVGDSRAETGEGAVPIPE